LILVYRKREKTDQKAMKYFFAALVSDLETVTENCCIGYAKKVLDG
jgi:hypothetical protein